MSAVRITTEDERVSIIEEYASNGYTKPAIVKLMKHDLITDEDIMKGWAEFCERNDLYEVTFNQLPIGITIAIDRKSKKTIISSFSSNSQTAANNGSDRLSLGSLLYEIITFCTTLVHFSRRYYKP